MDSAAFTVPPWLAPWLGPWLIWGLAFTITLVLAAWCTPRAWWRRPNARALAVLGGGTFVFGMLLSALLPSAPAPLEATAAVRTAAVAAVAPAAGARYRVAADLNLREDRGVRAVRRRVLRAGTIVTATGATDGDWWQVRARADGRAVDGWASSLWLRRIDEGR
ncbi:SH3 domain-containing protein [Massilia sp. Root335]|uniref:SH3 domain-containing protein n=1 Tax=Massilia sp. Root335 TaxID=1736517 RepID=UPI000A61F8EA|nr:SH3 domain-containing protein [Massilia sp. Root335]